MFIDLVLFLYKSRQLLNLEMSQSVEAPNQSYQLSRYRYVNLLIFVLAAVVNGLPAQAYASIDTLVQRQFQYSSVIVTLNVLLSPIMHPFMATPCNIILDKLGIRIGCTLGGILVILGVWMRVLMQVQNPTWPIIGSVFCAMGNVFILSSPSIFAIKWFNSQSVPKVISATVLINLLSSGTGASLAGLMLPNHATTDQIINFFRFQAILVTIPYLLFFIFFRQKPINPPSKAAQIAQQKQTNKKQPYIKTVKALLAKSAYLKIVAAMSFSYGIFLSFISNLDDCLDIIGYDNPGKVTSITLGAAILMGAGSAFFFSNSIRKSYKYREIITLCLLGAFVTFSLLCLTFSFKVKSFIVIGIMAACAGFFVIPLTALFTMYSTELSFPVAQGSATGYLFAGSQTVGFISGLLWVQILDETNKWKVYLFFGIHSLCLLVSLAITWLTPQQLNKLNYQSGARKKVQTSPQSTDFSQSLLSTQSNQQKTMQQ